MPRPQGRRTIFAVMLQCRLSTLKSSGFNALLNGMFLAFAVGLVSCSGTGQGAYGTSGAGVGDYQDFLHPEYMSTPTVVHFPDTAAVHLNAEDYSEFKEDLFGFMRSNNEAEYRTHFENYYIPETFPTDSTLNLYVRMWHQWDSIGVTTRFDHWTLLYASPFEKGEVYDVCLAEVRLRHHMVFQKRWTGNYKNFGRTLGQRYPGGTVVYRDTTYVDAAGDTVLRRHITAEADRWLYAVRAANPDSIRLGGIRWMNDGWQTVPEAAAVMDSAAVAAVEAHCEMYGVLPERPKVSGR